MSVKEALYAARQQVLAREQNALLAGQSISPGGIRRMAENNLPYDPIYPPCHIRVKQAVFLGGCFAGGIGLVAEGWTLFMSAIHTTGGGLYMAMILPGFFLTVYAVGATAATCLCPVEYSYSTRGYDKANPCLPCIGWPCNYYVCHCTELDESMV